MLTPKLFKFALMLPLMEDYKKANLTVDDKFQHVTIDDEEVHPNDVVGQLYDSHASHGGQEKHAHVFSSFNDVLSAFPSLILEGKKNLSKVGSFLKFYHGGQKIASGKSQNLFKCFDNSAMRNLIKFELQADDSVTLKTPIFEENFSKQDFQPVEEFLTEVCHLIEYSSLHQHSFDRQMLAYHLESFKNLSTELKEKFLPILESGLEFFRKNIEKAYGKENVEFFISQFAQSDDGKMPKNDHSQRILTTIEDVGTLKADDAFTKQGNSLRYIFSIFWILFLFYVIVWVFQIECYKDS